MLNSYGTIMQINAEIKLMYLNIPKKGIGNCVYCGNEDQMSADHVFPRSIFLQSDKVMLTVPSCSDCQRVKALGDNDLPIAMTLDYYGLRHPDSRDHVIKYMKRGEATRSWMFGAMESAIDGDLVTNDGEVLEKLKAIKYNRRRIDTMMSLVGRGLYFLTRGSILPQSSVSYAMLPPFYLRHSWLELFRPGLVRWGITKGNGVVIADEYRIETENEYETFWAVCFGGGLVYFIGTDSWGESLKLRHDEMKESGAHSGEWINTGLPADFDARFPDLSTLLTPLE